MPFPYRLPPPRTLLTLAALIGMALLLAACGPETTVKPQQVTAPADARAWRLLQQGQPAAAAAAFMALAASSDAGLARGCQRWHREKPLAPSG